MKLHVGFFGGKFFKNISSNLYFNYKYANNLGVLKASVSIESPKLENMYNNRFFLL